MKPKRVIAAAVVAGLLLIATGAGAAAVAGQIFGPNDDATRCQVITFMWRDAGSPPVAESHPFIDEGIPPYCEPALRWAWSRGITTGVGWFDPDPISGRSWNVALEQAIVDAAAEFGANQYVMEEIARCESGGNPDAKNPTSTAGGPWQWLTSSWLSRSALLGYPADAALRFDPVASARVTAFTIATAGTGDWSPYSGHCSTAY